MDNKKVLMPYFKLYYDNIELLEKHYTPEQIGVLIIATSKYSHDGTESEIPQELAFAYGILKSKVDLSSTAYLKKCETNRENGSKGGKAKAAKGNKQAKESSDTETKSEVESGFSMKKQEFKNIISHFKSEERYTENVDSYVVDQEYEVLCDNNWCIGAAQIKSKDDVEKYLFALFGDNYDYFIPERYGQEDAYRLFIFVYSKYDGLRTKESKISCALEEVCGYLGKLDKRYKEIDWANISQNLNSYIEKSMEEMDDTEYYIIPESALANGSE